MYQQDMEKMDPSYTAGKNENGTVALENSPADPQKVKLSYLLHDPTIPLLSMYPREMKTHVHINICTFIHIKQY